MLFWLIFLLLHFGSDISEADRSVVYLFLYHLYSPLSSDSKCCILAVICAVCAVIPLTCSLLKFFEECYKKNSVFHLICCLSYSVVVTNAS